ENSGLGRVLIGLRYQFCQLLPLEVRIVRGDGIRRSGDGGKPPASTYCSVSRFHGNRRLNSRLSSLEGVLFNLKNFQKSRRARCVQPAVHAGAGARPGCWRAAISEATLLLTFRLHGKHGGGARVEALTVRLVLSKQHNGQHQEICWVDLGSDVKRGRLQRPVQIIDFVIIEISWINDILVVSGYLVGSLPATAIGWRALAN
uniref:Uncharacterized protein n=1 Tax=Macrostomum lignano TaxID=282301 RepID=A0A1I8F4D7_9PLAT